MAELYTVVTNKAAKKNKSSIIAIIARTKRHVVISHLQKVEFKKRNQVT